MPTLDVSEIIDDPEFSTDFTLRRSGQSVGANGRTVETESCEIMLTGVVQPTGEDNVLTAEGVSISRFIEIVTKTQLFPARTGFSADRVVWRGNTYVVKSLSDWSQWGEGFYEANAELLPLVTEDCG